MENIVQSIAFNRTNCWISVFWEMHGKKSDSWYHGHFFFLTWHYIMTWAHLDWGGVSQQEEGSGQRDTRSLSNRNKRYLKYQRSQRARGKHGEVDLFSTMSSIVLRAQTRARGEGSRKKWNLMRGLKIDVLGWTRFTVAFLKNQKNQKCDHLLITSINLFSHLTSFTLFYDLYQWIPENVPGAREVAYPVQAPVSGQDIWLEPEQ